MPQLFNPPWKCGVFFGGKVIKELVYFIIIIIRHAVCMFEFVFWLWKSMSTTIQWWRDGGGNGCLAQKMPKAIFNVLLFFLHHKYLLQLVPFLYLHLPSYSAVIMSLLMCYMHAFLLNKIHICVFCSLMHCRVYEARINFMIPYIFTIICYFLSAIQYLQGIYCTLKISWIMHSNSILNIL